MVMKFTNNATTTLASNITSSATSLTVSASTGSLFPTLGGSDYFYCTLANTSGAIEIVKVTARSTDTFTITRGQDGTSGQAWNSGDKVELRLVAASLNDIPKLDEANTFSATQTVSTLTSPASTALTLQSAGTTAITVDASQNVIVGTGSTTVPLTVTKNPSSSSSSLLYLNPSTGTNASVIGFNNSGSGGFNIGRSDSAGAGSGTTITAYDSFVATTGTTGLSFHTNNTRAMYIDSGQNVGIGTSSPSVALELSKGNNTALRVIDDSANGRGGYMKATGTTVEVGTTSGVRPLLFTIDSVEKARIDTSGNLLVGTTSNLNGSKFSVYNNVAGNYCTGYKSTKDGSNASYFVSFQNDANSLVGYIVSANQTGTNYTSVSDYRLKEDVKPMTGALDKVALLKPCIYKWKVNGSDGQGFIAHELAEVCPDAVTGEKDAVDAEGKPVYQGIDTSFLVATLTAALQETKALIDTQAETINAQSAALAALTARVVALEAK